MVPYSLVTLSATHSIDTGESVIMVLNTHLRAFYLIDIDLPAQLFAIKNLLDKQSQNESKVSAQIESLKASIHESGDNRLEELVNSRDHHYHYSVFQCAAHSMSAVGMLAPFVESLFVSIFAGLRDYQRKNRQLSDCPTVDECDQFWDPHVECPVSGKRGFVKGVIRLSDSTGLTPFLPDNTFELLSALFAYRNLMFHNGFEWPMNKLQYFDDKIHRKNWQEWFAQAKSGEDPWIFYMSDKLIANFFEVVEEVLEGLGEFLFQNDQRPSGLR